MRAIEFLREIKKLDVKINMDIEDLAALEALSTKTTSFPVEDKVQSSGNQQKMENCTVKMIELKNQINAEIDKLIDRKNEARMLLAVCDAECMELLHKRYFMFKTWEQIAVEMNYTYQWVSDGLHRKALSQFQRALDERGKVNEWTLETAKDGVQEPE